MIPGIQCERCHGSSDEHLAAVKGGQTAAAPSFPAIRSLRKLSTEDTSNFCGQCHRRWDDIAASGITGISNIRFQPYRLTNSKCYDSEDRRIRCTACHDPHREIRETMRTTTQSARPAMLEAANRQLASARWEHPGARRATCRSSNCLERTINLRITTSES